MGKEKESSFQSVKDELKYCTESRDKSIKTLMDFTVCDIIAGQAKKNVAKMNMEIDKLNRELEKHEGTKSKN